MSSTASPAAGANSRRWLALGLIAAAQFMVIMDTSIIGVALPEMQDALGFSQSGLSWVFNAYVVAFGGLLLLGGKLVDLYGARRILVAGFALLTGASLLTGVAGSEGVLLAGRPGRGHGRRLPRRRPDRVGRLALGLPDQHPDRPGRPGRQPVVPAGPARPPRRPGRGRRP